MNQSIDVQNIFKDGDLLRHIACIIQFGSSLHSTTSGDIDLCVVVRKGAFYPFLAAIQDAQIPATYDISLLREEELLLNPFRFGSHGPHLLLSIKKGVLLHGKNLFLEIPDPDQELVRASILDRLYDYLYEVRKLEVSNAVTTVPFQKRWGKFQRLAAFLLLPRRFTFPEVLSFPKEELVEALKEAGIKHTDTFTAENFEYIWEKLSKTNTQS